MSDIKINPGDCNREKQALAREYGVPIDQAVNVKFRKTGEYRSPKVGDWYVSGSIEEAYHANHDFIQKYHILEPDTVDITVIKHKNIKLVRGGKVTV